eukprot:6195712-Pleurochrysis_carterae.AAC.3
MDLDAAALRRAHCIRSRTLSPRHLLSLSLSAPALPSPDSLPASALASAVPVRIDGACAQPHARKAAFRKS